MLSFFRQTRGLFVSWGVYWTALALVTLGPAARAIWRATHMPDGQGNVGINFGDGVFSLSVTAAGQSIYTGSVHLLALALWIAGPPLLLWFVWLALRPRPERVSSEV